MTTFPSAGVAAWLATVSWATEQQTPPEQPFTLVEVVSVEANGLCSVRTKSMSVEQCVPSSALSATNEESQSDNGACCELAYQTY